MRNSFLLGWVKRVNICGEPVERSSSTEGHRGGRGDAGHTDSHPHKYAFQHVVTVLGTGVAQSAPSETPLDDQGIVVQFSA